MPKLLAEKLWVEPCQEEKDALSIIKEGCRLRYKGIITTERDKNTLVKTMKRVVEVGEEVKRSNVVHQNIDWNEK